MRRLAVYATVLLGVGIWACFTKLDRGMLIGDEATTAVTTDIMLETGDWIVPRSAPTEPHLNATPLYNWLCCLTANYFDDTPFRYRMWAAVFGVLCPLVVLLLGMELFNAEVGFLAGVLLVTDCNYLFFHSARSGVMESGLMLFITSMVYCYVRAKRVDSRAGNSKESKPPHPRDSQSDSLDLSSQTGGEVGAADRLALQRKESAGDTSPPVWGERSNLLQNAGDSGEGDYPSSSRAGMWWALMGVCLGGAVLMKPPAPGGFFFIVLALHHLVTQRDLAWKPRMGRPLLALAVAGLVSLPWYGLLFLRLGPSALGALFIDNSAGRMTANGPGIIPDPWFYLEFIWRTPSAAKLYWPALGVGALCAVCGWRRSSWALPVLLASAYTFTISFSNVKAPHYLHYAVPFLCILTAAVLLMGFLPRPSTLGDGELSVFGWQVLATCGVILAVMAFRVQLSDDKETFRYLGWEYPPLVVHQTIERTGNVEQANLILFRYPNFNDPLDIDLGFGMPDRFYSTRLQYAKRVNRIEELNALLREEKPTVVFLPPSPEGLRIMPADLAHRPEKAGRIRVWHLHYPMLTFHGAEAKLGLEEFVKSGLKPEAIPGR